MMFPVPDSPRIAVTELLPHTGTARLLTDVVRTGSDSIEAIGRVPSTHPLVTAGRAPCFLGLELGAQAAAALEALQRASANRGFAARIGRLARVRDASFFEPDLPADVPLNVVAQLEGSAPPLAIYRIHVRFNGVDVLRATLSTMLGADE